MQWCERRFLVRFPGLLYGLEVQVEVSSEGGLTFSH